MRVGSLYARCRAQSCDPVSGPRFRSACADICKLLKLAQLSGFVASRLAPVALLGLAALTACSRGPAPLILEGPTMGTRYLVAVHDPVLSRSEATALVTAALDEVTRMLSNWEPDSEVSRLNAHCGAQFVIDGGTTADADPVAGGERVAWGETATATADVGTEMAVAGQMTNAAGDGTSKPFAVSPGFVEVALAARTVHAQSEGAFDPSVVPVSELWGFGPGIKPGSVSLPPVASAIAAALEAVDYGALKIDQATSTLACARPGMALDFSALGKGYGVDRVIEALQAAGVENALVEIGGEVRAIGQKRNGEPFRVGIALPVVGADGLMGERTLRDAAVATSGNYRNFIELGGERFGHLMDPRSGWPVDTRLAAVSVEAPTTMMADAWATALMVLGPEQGPAIARKAQLTALFVMADGATVKVPNEVLFYEYQ